MVLFGPDDDHKIASCADCIGFLAQNTSFIEE